VVEVGAGGFDGGVESGRVRVAHLDGVPRHLRQYPLGATLVDDRAQHVVPGHHLVPGRLQAVRVQGGEAEFAVPVAADAAVGERVAPAEQVRGLHVGERERFVPVLRARHGDRSGGVAQRGDHLVAVRPQRGPALVGEHPGRCAEPDLAVVLPQVDAEPGQLDDEVVPGHIAPSS
jgi:hypothetical protein